MALSTGQSGIGTGGYVLKQHDPGVRSFTTRNPNYWKEGFAHFDEVEITQIGDPTARSQALQGDQLDVMNNVPTKTVHLLKRVPGIKIDATTGNKQITLPMRTDMAPFDNNDVRTAVKYIIDREAVAGENHPRVTVKLGNDSPDRSGQYLPRHRRPSYRSVPVRSGQGEVSI